MTINIFSFLLLGFTLVVLVWRKRRHNAASLRISHYDLPTYH